MITLKKDMLIVDAIDAGHGDSILLRFHDKDGDVTRMILVDGGPRSAKIREHEAGAEAYVPYETRIVPWLQEIQKAMGEPDALGVRGNNSEIVLDLVVCTHIDDDHIAGIDRLYNCLANTGDCPPGGADIEAKRLWFNSFSAMMSDVDIDEATIDQSTVVIVSVKQGETVTKNANRYQATINDGAPGNLIAGIHEWTTQFQPAKVTVLNPDKKSLENLARDWKKEMAKVKSDALTAEAGGKFPKDRAVPNLSSIVMTVECFGRSVLLTGDQLSENIMTALDASTTPHKIGVFHFDVVKVPHHGSIANVQQDFVDRVTAEIFVFCANGKDQNPDPPTLEMYAKAGESREFTMAFTNGDLVYETGPKKPLQKIGGKEVATLDEALAALKTKYPKFAKNVKILKRSPSSHALSLGLGDGGKIQISGGVDG